MPVQQGGWDFAGTVETAGPGVQSLRPGDAVFGVVTKPTLGDGAFGEYVTAAEASTVLVPAGLDLAMAGALGLAGTAALSTIDAIDPLRVLLSGRVGAGFRRCGFTGWFRPRGLPRGPSMAVVLPHLQVVRPRFAAGAPPGPAASPTPEGQQ